MHNFIYAAELKKQYQCFGHFYELLHEDGSRSKCRSVLEIADMSAGDPHLEALSQSPPHAVVIMMNPGSSRPKEAGHVDGVIQYGMPQRSNLPKPLVLTMPDTTQYQVMRLMRARGWRHVRVLNLSDLREPKSHKLFKKIKSLEERTGGSHHSICCHERGLEFRESLKRRKGAPVIAAWGLDSFLASLARRCLDQVGADAIVGLPSRDDRALFFHPSPMLQKGKERWLAEMLGRL